MALFDRLRKSYGDGGSGSNTTTTARRSSPTAGSGSNTYPTSPAAGRVGGFGPGQNRIGAGGGAGAGGMKPNWSAPLSQEGTPNPTTSTSTVVGARPVASRRRGQVSPGQTPTRSTVEAFPTMQSQEEIALSPVDAAGAASPSVFIMDSSSYGHGEHPAPENRDPENIKMTTAATGVNRTSNNHATHDDGMVAPSSVPSRLDPRSNEVVRSLEERQRGGEGEGTTGDTTRSSNHPSPTTSSIPTNFEDVLVAQRHQLANTEKGFSGGSTTITPAPSSHTTEKDPLHQHHYSAEETANTSSLLGLPHQLRRDRELFHLRTVDSKLAKDSNHRVGSPWRHKQQQQTHNSSGAPQKPEDLFDSVVAGSDVEREHIPTKQPEVPFPIVLTKETGAQADNISHSESLAPEDLTAEAALHQLGPKASYLDKMETYQRLKQQETEMLVSLGGDRGEISNNQDQTDYQPGQGARPAAAFAFAEERKELDRQRAEIRDKEKRLQQWASQLKDWADQLESREAYLMQEAAAQQENHLRSMAVLAQKEMKIRQQETVLKLSTKQPEPPRWQTTAKLGTPRRVEDGMQSSVFGSEGAPTTTLIKSNTNSSSGAAMGGTNSASGDILGVGKPQHQVLAFGNKYDGMVDDRVKDFTWEDRWQAAMDAAKSERNEAKKR